MLGLTKIDSRPRTAAIIELPVPEVGPGDVLVRIEACGLCGTDLSLYLHPETFAADIRIRFPIVFGHEFAGYVAAVDTSVRNVKVGDLVVVNPHLFCKVCEYCLTGRPEICDNRPILGIHQPGGFAEFVKIRSENVYPLKSEVDSQVAALAEPLTVALHAARRARVSAGSVPVIVGAGPIGLLIGVACQEAGANQVLIAGLPADRHRLEIGRKLGLTPIVIVDGELRAAVDQVTGAHGAEIVFEASGSPSGLKDAIRAARKDGTIVTIGIPHNPVPVDIARLTLAEKRLIGCRGYAPEDWVRAVTVLERRSSELASLVSTILPLRDYEMALNLLESRKGIKIMLSPRASSLH